MAANSKLTLSVDKDIIEKAKVYAQHRGKSLSGMIEDYLKLVLRLSDMDDEKELPPITASLQGVISLENRDYRDIYEEALLEKHKLK